MSYIIYHHKYGFLCDIDDGMIFHKSIQHAQAIETVSEAKALIKTNGCVILKQEVIEVVNNTHHYFEGTCIRCHQCVGVTDTCIQKVITKLELIK